MGVHPKTPQNSADLRQKRRAGESRPPSFFQAQVLLGIPAQHFPHDRLIAPSLRAGRPRSRLSLPGGSSPAFAGLAASHVHLCNIRCAPKKPGRSPVPRRTPERERPGPKAPGDRCDSASRTAPIALLLGLRLASLLLERLCLGVLHPALLGMLRLSTLAGLAQTGPTALLLFLD